MAERYRDGDTGSLDETTSDQRDMLRMGRGQELRRNHHNLSTVAFMVILQGSWEVLLVACREGLTNGGLAGLFWSSIWTFAGMTPVVLSLAEMVSMAPTSGGQYHWVSEFAPRKWQRLLSYYTGWVSVMSWQAGAASGPCLVGTLLHSVFDDHGVRHGGSGTWWEAGFIVMTMLAVHLCNCHSGSSMPALQNILLLLHLLGVLIIVAALMISAPRQPAFTVLTDFSNHGGWSSMALSLMIGQKTAINAFTGFDAAAHLSEEVKDAGRVVPRAMIESHVLSGGLGITFLAVFLLKLTDVQAALDDDSGYPFLFIFNQSFSPATVRILGTIVIGLLFAGTVSYNLSSSRQFARDNGLPLSPLIAAVDREAGVPMNAARVTAIVAIALSLVNIGSNAAFNAIISLNIACLMWTYVVSIACLLHFRFHQPELLPKARWTLGRGGVVTNIAALAYSSFALFWSFWPNLSTLSLPDFNWAIVMLLATLLVAKVDWECRAKYTYLGPVHRVTAVVDDEGRNAS